MTRLVIDISHYQGTPSFRTVAAAGLVGVIMKVTEGTGVTDPGFQSNRTAALAAGLLVGGYHFIRPGNIAAQASRFVRSCLPYDDNFLFALDHETAGVSLDDVKLFLSTIQKATGRMPVLYSGNVIKEQLGNSIDPDLAKYRFWLAQYSSNPSWPKTWVKPWLWQYSATGKVPGISGDVDLDDYAGTPEQLAAEWAGSMAGPAVSPPVPPTPPKEPPIVLIPPHPATVATPPPTSPAAAAAITAGAAVVAAGGAAISTGIPWLWLVGAAIAAVAVILFFVIRAKRG